MRNIPMKTLFRLAQEAGLHLRRVGHDNFTIRFSDGVTGAGLSLRTVQAIIASTLTEKKIDA